MTVRQTSKGIKSCAFYAVAYMGAGIVGLVGMVAAAKGWV